MINKIEKELRKAFPDLSSYFDNVFLWLKQEQSSIQLFVLHLKTKGIEEIAAYYSLLHGQLTAQIKHGADAAAPNEKLFAVWEYLLDKLTEHKYITLSRAEEIRADMTEWIKNNG